MKRPKHSVSLVIRGAGGRVLLVLRPGDDDDLPGVWGLPAVSLRSGETEDEAVVRAGREKLGVEVRPGRLVGEVESDRPEGAIRMRDREAAIVGGGVRVPQPHAGTQYVDWRWGEPEDLVPAARRGSLCSQVLLRGLDTPW